MAERPVSDFPLFPLSIVLLPSEIVPLHIFEDRYKTMIGECLDAGREFGIVWMSDDGLKEIGCTARVAEVLERMDDGKLNILVQGGTPFRLVRRQDEFIYPAGTVELLDDEGEAEPEAEGPSGGADEARERYADLLEQITDERPDEAAVEELSAYEMAASLEIDLPVKQGLLETRSERTRMRMLAKLFKEGAKRLAVAQRIAERARTNGKVSFEERDAGGQGSEPSG